MCDSDLSKWEAEAIDSVEAKYEEVALAANVDSEAHLLRLETRFKEVALAITQLYTSFHSNSSNTRVDAYSAFRTAACKLTDFYNESKECHSVIRERSRRYGQTSKDRDLAKWAKTRRRMVRREDILSSITGKSPPTRQSAPTASQFGRHGPSLGRSSESFGVAVRHGSRNSPQRRSPRPSTSTTQTHKPRRNSLFNKDLSHLQEEMGDFSMGSPPRPESSRKRAFQMFDEAVADIKRPKIDYFRDPEDDYSL